MSFARQKHRREGVRRYTAAALVVLYMASITLSLFAGAAPGYSAQRGLPQVLFSPENSLASQAVNGTVDALWSEHLPGGISPHAVSRWFARAPYRTGDWGTMEQGQAFGVNGTTDPYGNVLLAAAGAVAGATSGAPDKGFGGAQAKSKKSARATVSDTGKPQQSEKIVRLFSTVDFRSPLKDMPKWEGALNKERRNPSFGADGSLRCASGKTAERWQNLRDSLQGAALMDKIKGVNSFFNKWSYRSDSAVWGVEDYWASPCEFIVKSGDCEDYAIAKYFALKSLGVPVNSMRIAAVTDTIRGIGHAVLVIYIGGDAYVLDNLSNLVLSHKRLKHYRPLFTVNENYLWRHVKPVAGPDSK